MEHSHASKKECLNMLNTKKRKTASEKKGNNIERSSAKKPTKMDSNTLCSDNSDGKYLNNNDDHSKTDQTKNQHHQPFHLP
eukprot:5108733-Ditylum_brightwellii.AAC.1